MADRDQVQLLLSDQDAWQRWRQDAPGATVDLRDAELNKQSLAGLNFGWGGISVNDGGELVPHRSHLERVNFAGTKLADATFAQAILDNAQFGGADLQGAVLADVVAPSAKFRYINGIEAGFVRADLQGCDFTGAKLERARLDESNLKGSNFDRADLTQASFSDVQIDRSTVLDRITFSASHDELADGSDRIALTRIDRILNWGRLRFISEMPLFGISYVGVVVALLLGHIIGFTNEEILSPARNVLSSTQSMLERGAATLDNHVVSRGAATQMLSFAATIRDVRAALPEMIHFPTQLAFAVVSTILLAAGSTIYKISCPHSVQRFTEIEWVAQLRRPRLLYLRDSLGCGTRTRARAQLAAQLATAIFVFSGAAIAVILFALRMLRLIQVIMQYG